MSRIQSAPPVAPNVLGVVAQPGASRPASEGGGDSLAERAAEALAGRALAGGAIERDDVTLAWELARLVASPRRTQAFALALAVLEATRAGSTRLRLRGVGQTDAAPRVAAVAEALSRGAQLELPFAAPPDLAARGAGPEPSSERAIAARLAELAPLVGTEEDRLAPLVHEGGCVALRRWATKERTLARDLFARTAIGTSADAARAFVEALRARPLRARDAPMQLTDEQEAGVVAMLSERTVVLTGGPGTGKTSVVVSLLRALALRAHAEGGLERVATSIRLVALAAPTGKAADRLGEAVRGALASSTEAIDVALGASLSDPSTIHRLLGYRRGGGFRANRHNRLAHRVVLVDEVSMIDTSLFAHLLAAVAPDATLVLLGDPDQLPSVDPGAVLRDLVLARPRGVAVHALTKSHRMDPRDPEGAHVLSVARACLAGGARRVPFRTMSAVARVGAGGAPSSGAPVGVGGAWHLEAAELPRVLDAWIARHLVLETLWSLEAVDTTTAPGGHAPSTPDDGRELAPPEVRAALVHLARARILTVTRRSAEDLDAYVAAAIARSRGQSARARRILPGEPVLVVHNDYDENLWNGDSGVAWRDSRGEMHVSFRRGSGYRTRPLAAVAHLVERSHAVTVHKAQGSEHDEVLFVLPPADTPLSSREIVYTAITRARRSAIVVGREELLGSALERSSTRETGLADALMLTGRVSRDGTT